MPPERKKKPKIKKVEVLEMISYDWRCPSCSTEHERGNMEQGQIIKCDECKEKFEADVI